jgi:hypothetical protein
MTEDDGKAEPTLFTYTCNKAGTKLDGKAIYGYPDGSYRKEKVRKKDKWKRCTCCK